MMDDPLTHVYLKFIISVGSIFEHFLKLLQGQKTLIHILYDELGKLLLKLMRRFINESILQGKEGENLLAVDIRKEALNAKLIDVGNSTKKALASLENTEGAEFVSKAKEFYIHVTEYLQLKLPLKNKLLQCLQVLHPLTRKEPVKCTLHFVRRLGNLLPEIIPEESVDKLTDEWHRYVTDLDILEEWMLADKPVDDYWNHVFNLTNNSGCQRYPFLTMLVKASLTFSHGQASVERGFSVNKRMVTAEKSRMKLDTIRGLRLIKDAVKGKAAEVCVTQEMLQFHKDSYAKYKAQKDAEKMNQEKSLQPKINAQGKQTTEQKLKGLRKDISSAQAIIEEGNERLKTGLKRKSMHDIEAAQALIDAGNKRLKAAQDEISKNASFK